MAILGNNTILGLTTITSRGPFYYVQSTEAGNATSLSFYLRSTGTATIRYVIYSDIAGAPGALLAQSVDGSVNTTSQWITIPISYSFANGETMFIGVKCTDYIEIAYDAGATNQLAIIDAEFRSNYPTVDNPAVTFQQFDNTMSGYITYTPSALPASITGIATLKGIQTLKF